MPKLIGVIPARYKSSRFPGKPLADIHGKPMIWWVFQNSIQVSDMEEVYVATDDERIEETCKKYNMPYIMTSENHPTGTDRIAEVAQKIDADYYVNIQGDEPLISPETIKMALTPVHDKQKFDVINLMTEITDSSDLINSTVPKVVVNDKGEAIFLSRSGIPFPKNKRPKYFKQVCVYVFTKNSLHQFSKLSQGPIEQAEDIEILRFIENRMVVRMIEVEEATVAVDTPADLKIVRDLLSERNG